MLSVVHRKGRTFLTRLTVGGILKGTLSAYTCLQITANVLTKLYSSMLKGLHTFPATQCQIVGTTSRRNAGCAPGGRSLFVAFLLDSPFTMRDEPSLVGQSLVFTRTRLSLSTAMTSIYKKS